MASTHRALPVLLRICAVIDQLFIVEVGPFGQQLAADARTEWLATGNRLRPADVERFVELGRTTDKLLWARELRDWVRNELIPRRDHGGRQE